jgi:malonate transporter
MLATLNAVAPIFLIIVIGNLLFRFRVVGEDIWSAIEHICFYLLFPFLLVRTLARADLTQLSVFEFALVVLLAPVVMGALLFALRPLLMGHFHLSGPAFTSLFQGATRFHGFMAVAIIGPLYGAPGLALAALAIGLMVPLLNVISVVILTAYGDAGQAASARILAIRIVQNPLIIACMAGLALNMTGVPDFMFGAIQIIGDGGLGLALLAVGAGLQLDSARETKTLVSVGVLIRLIGMPLIIILVSWLVGLEGLPRTIAIIAGAVPTASTAYVMARKMGGDAELMANIVTFQVIAAAVTLPLFIYIAELLRQLSG